MPRVNLPGEQGFICILHMRFREPHTAGLKLSRFLEEGWFAIDPLAINGAVRVRMDPPSFSLDELLRPCSLREARVVKHEDSVALLEDLVHILERPP